MIRGLLIIMFVAGAAWAGPGFVATAGELGGGFIGTTVGGLIPMYIILEVPLGGGFEDELEAAVVTGAIGATGACSLGVWVAGEWLDGRSADRGRSFWGAAAGSALGMAGTATCLYLANAYDEHTGNNEVLWIGPAVLLWLVGMPALGTVGYNFAKEVKTDAGSHYVISPAVTVRRPLKDNVPVTPVFGACLTF